jgi:hypothetical protein
VPQLLLEVGALLPQEQRKSLKKTTKKRRRKIPTKSSGGAVAPSARCALKPLRREGPAPAGAPEAKRSTMSVQNCFALRRAQSEREGEVAAAVTVTSAVAVDAFVGLALGGKEGCGGLDEDGKAKLMVVVGGVACSQRPKRQWLQLLLLLLLRRRRRRSKPMPLLLHLQSLWQPLVVFAHCVGVACLKMKRGCAAAARLLVVEVVSTFTLIATACWRWSVMLRIDGETPLSPCLPLLPLLLWALHRQPHPSSRGSSRRGPGLP